MPRLTRSSRASLALHSYDVPCIVTWPIDKVLGSYADWVEKRRLTPSIRTPLEIEIGRIEFGDAFDASSIEERQLLVLEFHQTARGGVPAACGSRVRRSGPGIRPAPAA